MERGVLASRIQQLLELKTWPEKAEWVRGHPELLSEAAHQQIEYVMGMELQDWQRQALIEHDRFLALIALLGLEQALGLWQQPATPDDPWRNLPAELQARLAAVDSQEAWEELVVQPQVYAVMRQLQISMEAEAQPADDELMDLLQRLRVGPARPERLALLHRALELAQPQDNPELWGSLQAALAKALMDAPAGALTSEDGEAAIAAYQAALSVLSRESDPAAWAKLQNGLGITYDRRLAGSRAENLEHAIAAYQQALTVRNRQETPIPWAETVYNLGMAYSSRIHGDPADNQERAIEAFQGALQVTGLEDHRQYWLDTMVNLGNVYSERLRGDRALNLEQALDFYQQAAVHVTPEQDPERWAHMQHELCLLYRQRLRGQPVENLERAIRCGQAALQYTPPELQPRQWAESATALGSAYLERVLGERTDNLQTASRFFSEALRLLPPDHRTVWVVAQYNLGLAYLELGATHAYARRQFLEKAATAFSALLQGLPYSESPRKWVQTAAGFAAASLGLGRLADFPDQRQAYFQHAAGALKQAESKLPELGDINLAQLVYRRLGDLHFAAADWEPAQAAYRRVLEAGEQLYQAGATSEGRLYALESRRNFSAKAAYSLARLGRPGEALKVLETSLARGLAEALGRNWLAETLAGDDPDRQRYAALRARLQALEAEARPGRHRPLRPYVQIAAELGQVRAELGQVVERLQQAYPQLRQDDLALPEIAALARDPGRALVYLLTLESGSLALLLSPGQAQPSSLWLDSFTDADLAAIFNGGGPGGRPGYLLSSLLGYSRQLEVVLAQALPLLAGNLLQPLVEHLQGLGVTDLLLIPTGGLRLLPLPALFPRGLAVSLAPSARVAALAGEQRARLAAFTAGVLAVGNPANALPPLAYAGLEAAGVWARFPWERSRFLSGDQATLARLQEALPGSSHLHFAGHASFDLLQPLDSGLYLAGEQVLTTANLLDGVLDLSSLRLVVLSACQTGLTDYRQVPDEAAGLPAAFLQAGVPGVVSTLWPVDDLSTALLMDSFYRALIEDGQPPARALQHAQLWLQTLTAEGLQASFEALLSRTPDSGSFSTDQLQAARQWIASLPASELPFSGPRHWAAFVYTGV